MSYVKSEINKLGKSELIEMAKELELDESGTKEELIERIVEAIPSGDDAENQSDDELKNQPDDELENEPDDKAANQSDDELKNQSDDEAAKQAKDKPPKKKKSEGKVKVKVVKNYDDKSLERIVRREEVLTVSEARAKVLIEHKVAEIM